MRRCVAKMFGLSVASGRGLPGGRRWSIGLRTAGSLGGVRRRGRAPDSQGGTLGVRSTFRSVHDRSGDERSGGVRESGSHAADDDFTQIKVTGKCQTPWFGANVGMNIAWRFLLDPQGKIFFVAIDLLASPKELLNLAR